MKITTCVATTSASGLFAGGASRERESGRFIGDGVPSAGDRRQRRLGRPRLKKLDRGGFLGPDDVGRDLFEFHECEYGKRFYEERSEP